MTIKNFFGIPIGSFKLETLTNDKINQIKKLIDSQNIDSPPNGKTGSWTIKQNLFDNPLFDEVKAECLKYTTLFSIEQKHVCQDIQIVSSWATILQQGQEFTMHKHSNSYISGVIHLDYSSPLVFKDHNTEHLYNLLVEKIGNNDDVIIFDSVPGNLILFPSNTYHAVPTIEKNENRYSLAFNTWPLKYGDLTMHFDLTGVKNET